MKPIEIRPNIYWIGVNDHETALFEGIWPISEEGISYNSYLIDDEKTVLIDLAKELTTENFLEQINTLTDISKIDYIVVNHMEPDHTGALTALRRIAPQAVILCTQKAVPMLQSFYGLEDNIQVVSDSDTLSTGRHTLRFITAPNVHWPETMFTYMEEEKILFTCDAFGGYGALEGALFDDETKKLDYYKQEALRYYTNIVSLFNKAVLKAAQKMAGLPVEVIAPSHGLVWRKDPQEIVALYQRWAEYATGAAKREAGVTMLVGTMYGNTKRIADAVAQGVAKEGLPLNVFDVAQTHPSYILASVFTKEGILIGAPTYEGGLYPPMAHVLDELARKRFTNRSIARFGSYGWNGGGEREFDRITQPIHWETFEAFDFLGGVTQQRLAQAEAFGSRYAKHIRQMLSE